MITTTKEEIRKAVMEALKSKSYDQPLGCGWDKEVVSYHDFPSVADLVAETLGGEG